MAFEGYFPKFTFNAKDTDNQRKGDGFGMIVKGVSMMADSFEGSEATDRLLDWFLSKGITTIDTVVIQHWHIDHFGGAVKMVESGKIRFKTVYAIDPLTYSHGVDESDNGRAVQEDIDNAYEKVRIFQAHGAKVLWKDHGDSIQVGDIHWDIFRKQPQHFTEYDDGHAYAFVNDGSLILYSPELMHMICSDGPCDQKDAIHYFQKKYGKKDILRSTSVTHHGGSYSKSNAEAFVDAGGIFAYESCIECDGPGTSDWTPYGSHRLIQAGATVWMQDEDIFFTAAGGRMMIRQGSKTITMDVPYIGTAQTGWVKDSKGWYYRRSDGLCVYGWAKLSWSKGVDWFYFNGSGYMVTGWQYLRWSQGNNWFYFDPASGAMRTGWVYADGEWYYLDNKTGAMLTGWVEYKGHQCYLEPVSGKNQGHCYRNCVAVIDGKTYSFDKDGYATEITTNEITVVTGKLNNVSASRKQFVIQIANYVRKYASQYGIKVHSPIIAQVIHESGWGESKLSVKYHNYFGMKCGTKWTGKSVNMSTQEEYSAGTLTNITANFRAYDSMEEGVKGYFEFIQLPRYSNLKGVTNPRKYLENIKADGYATGSSYVDHVMNLVSTYSLTQFDTPASTATSATQAGQDPVDVLIGIAQAEVGYQEGANNHTKYGDELHAIQPSNMDKNAAWCDAFVDWVILQTCRRFGKDEETAREVLCGDFDDYTYFSVNLYKKAGRWTSEPARGYQIFFGGSGHTGIVTKVEGGKVYTIEGNKSDAVRECSYDIDYSNIIGYGMPRYDLI